MGKYIQFFKLQLSNAFTYRGPMIIWMAGGLIAVTVMSAVWQNASGGLTMGGFTKAQLTTYYIMGFLFEQFTGWQPFSNVQEDIKNGNFGSQALLKPFSYFWLHIINEFTWHLLTVIFAIAAVIIAAALFKWEIVFNLTIISFVLLFLSLLISTMIFFLFCMCTGLLSLFFTEVRVIHSILLWGGIALLGGQSVPLNFLPEVIRNVATLLPYRYLYSFPLEIYLSKISIADQFVGLSFGLFWILIFSVLYKFLWIKGVRAYSAFGH